MDFNNILYVEYLRYNNYHARIQEFSSGGGGCPGQSDNKSCDNVFFCFCFSVLSLFYMIQKVNFKESKKASIFQGSSGGPTFSRGYQLFQRGGGSNCLFPIETHITCDFPGGGGVRTPIPPLDPHLTTIMKLLYSSKAVRPQGGTLVYTLFVLIYDLLNIRLKSLTLLTATFYEWNMKEDSPGYTKLPLMYMNTSR